MISVLYTLRVISVTVGLFGGFLLLSRSEGIRARIFFGGVMLAWGVTYLLAVVAMGQGKPLSGREFMPVFQTITGVLGSGRFMFYLMEAMCPGWLTWKRVLLVFSPYLLPYAVIDKYYGEITSGEMPVHVDGYTSTDLQTARIRSNHVKSDMILNKGLKEGHFVTRNPNR